MQWTSRILVLAFFVSAFPCPFVSSLRKAQSESPEEDANYWERLLQETKGSIDSSGAGTIGNDCFIDAECVTNSCLRDGPPESSGTCVCNVETGSGCKQGFICATSHEAAEAQGSGQHGCYLPLGTSCSPQGDNDCLTGNCDLTTNLCTCNKFSDYPCDKNGGEECIFKDGSYVCGLPPDCPPFSGFCTAEYAPVSCGGCEYSNQCRATGANPAFTPETCSRIP